MPNRRRRCCGPLTVPRLETVTLRVTRPILSRSRIALSSWRERGLNPHRQFNPEDQLCPHNAVLLHTWHISFCVAEEKPVPKPGCRYSQASRLGCPNGPVCGAWDVPLRTNV